MKRNKLGMIFVIVTLLVTLFLTFNDDNIKNALDSNLSVNLIWIVFAAVCWVVFLITDACSLYYFLRHENNRVSFGYAFFVSLIGSYYSNLTPAATGGQPMEVYYLNKKDVPISVSSSALATKFFCQQVVVVVITTVLWICNADFISTQLQSVRWAVYIGYFINFLSVPLIVLIATNKPLIEKIIAFIVCIGIKLRLIKKPEQARQRISVELDGYHTNIRQMLATPKLLIVELLLSALRIVALMSIALCVFYAFNAAGASWNEALTIAFLLFMSASYTPLPGSSGAQEGGFLLFYQGLFAQGTIGLALLVWRFFTFYFSIIVGSVVTLIAGARGKKEPENKALGESGPDDREGGDAAADRN